MKLVKDKSVSDLVSRIGELLPPDSWTVVDNWDADLFAIGFAAPSDPRRLVYVCTAQMPTGSFYVEYEIPGDTADDFRVSSKAVVQGVDELARCISEHLSAPSI